MISRYTPIDWYDDKKKTPRAYRDNETGEEITLYEYRKRKREALAVDEEEEEVDEEYETQAYAEPAPRPRLFSVPSADDAAPRPTVRRMGIAELLAPAVAGFGTSVALIRLRESPRQVFVPPKEVTGPLLRPVGRIIDRHLPTDFALLIGEDGKDVSEIIVALAATMTWFQDAMQAYEEYKEHEREQYADRSGPRNVQSPTTDPGYDWSANILRRVGAGGNGAPADGVRANGVATGAAVNQPSDADAATRIRDLFSAADEGRMRRGLDPGQ